MNDYFFFSAPQLRRAPLGSPHVPPRTNPFQSLIAFIERAVAPTGAKVTESALVDERASEIERETDVMITAEIGKHPVKIAVECRDHESPQDVTWIDSLIGKYQTLPVDKVVAVSRSGFTTAALAKATAQGIDAITLEDALKRDWPAELAKPELHFLVSNASLRSGRLEFEGPEGVPPPDVLRELPVVDSSGAVKGTVEGFLLEMHKLHGGPSVEEYASQKTKELLQTRGGEDGELGVRVEGRGMFVQLAEGKRLEIVAINLTEVFTLKTVAARHRYFFYNKTQVTLGALDLDADRHLSVAVVQTPERQQKFEVGWTIMNKQDEIR